MQALWESGLWLDIAIAITALELVVLGALHLFSRRGLHPNVWALNLCSGLLLMLALRSTLGGAAWHWPVMCLAASGLIHSADLWRRWRLQQTAIKPF